MAFDNNSKVVDMSDFLNQEEKSPYYEPTEQQKELISFVIDHTDRWRDYRDQNHMDDWERYERIFRGQWKEEDKTRQSERSRIISPATQQAVETRHAEVMEAIFGQGEYFDIQDDIADANGPIDVEKLKNQLYEDFKQDKIRKSIDQIELMAELYGTGIGEVIIGKEKVYKPHSMAINQAQMAYGTKEEDRFFVRLNPVNPKNFLFDPNGTSVDDCMGVAIERYVSIHKIMDGIKKGMYYDVDLSEFYKDESLEPTQESKIFRDQKVTFLTYYGLVPAEYLKEEDVEEVLDDKNEDYRDMVEAIVILANDKLLKAEKSPYMMQDRPVVTYQDDTVPNRLLGRGTVEKAFNMQVGIDAQMRAHLDSLALTTAPMVGLDATRLPRGAKYEIKAGKAWHFNGNPNEIVYPFKFGATDGQAMQTSKEFERMLLMATGTLDSQGMVSEGSRDAGGLAPAVAGIIKKYKRTLVNFQEDFLIPFIYKAAWRYMQFSPERYPSVDVKFIPTATLGIIAREYEQKQMAFMIQTLGGNSPITPILMNGMLKNSSLSNREQMIAQLQEMSKPNPQTQQLAMAKEQAAIQLEQAKAAETQAKAQEHAASAQKLMIEANLAPQEVNAEVNKIRAQMELEAQKAKAQLIQEDMRSRNDVAIERVQMEADKEVAIYKARLDAAQEAEKLALEKFKAELQAETKLQIEMIKQQGKEIQVPVDSMLGVIEQQFCELSEQLNKPRPLSIEYDENGKANSINGQPVKRDKEGRFKGI